MATNLIQLADATPIVWAHSDYSSVVSGLAKTSGLDLDLTSLGAGAARQGVKYDFTALRYWKYLIAVGFEFISGAVDSEEVEVWHAGSVSGTAANANPGGCSGSDAAYTGTTGSSLAVSIKQLQLLGTLPTTADNTPTVQYKIIGEINGWTMPRYGMPVVFNNTTPIMENDAVEMFVAYLPIGPQIQAAV